MMKYNIQNVKTLTDTEMISILQKSAKLYSEYVDTTLLFIFRTLSGNPRPFNDRDESASGHGIHDRVLIFISLKYSI